MKSELGSLIGAVLLTGLSALLWGALFAWVVDEHIGNLLGREVAFIDVWIISFMCLIYFSSIVNRETT